MIGVAAVGHVDGPAEIAEQRAAAKGSIVVEKRQAAIDPASLAAAARQRVEEGRGEIDRLRQALAA